MASFSVQYIFQMVDRFSGPARALAKASEGMARPIHKAGAAANAAVGALTRYGAAARQAAAHVNALAKAQVGAWLHGPGGMMARGKKGRMGGAAGVGGMFGGYMLGRGILQTAKEASAAENKFRSLVDNVSASQMAALEATISGQMKRTGETYADLMDAAADAAQILGDKGADLAKDVMAAASSLGQIDTAGMETSKFAENIAAALGQTATPESIKKFADMLAKQQKLGAATAGGTLAGYKEAAAMAQLTRTDTGALLTSLGLIKNRTPSLQDSQIGNMAKYGLRMFNMPTPRDLKSMNQLGFKPEDFRDATGAFDMQKTHKMLYDLSKKAGGLDKIRKAFAGKNVLAGQFWLSLLQDTPEAFAKYMQALNDSTGALDKASAERVKGNEGAINRITGAWEDLKRGIAKFIEPAMVGIAEWVDGALHGVRDFAIGFQKSFPLLSKLTGGAMILAGAFSVAALPLAAMAVSLRAIGLGFVAQGAGRLAASLAGVGWGWVKGIVGGTHALSRATFLAYRFAGALGAAKVLALGFPKVLAITLLPVALWELWSEWDKITAAFADPLKVDIVWPEAPEWLKNVLKSDWFNRGINASEKAREQGHAIRDSVYSWWSGGDAAAKTPPAFPPPVTPTNWLRSQFDWLLGPQTRTPSLPQNFLQQGSPRLPQGFTSPPAAAPGAGGANIPKAAAQDINVRTSLDPIQVKADTVTVKVTGTINGPVTGSAQMPLSATAPRGKSTAEPAAQPAN